MFFVLRFSTIYVADFGNKRLVGFKRFPRNELVKIWVSYFIEYETTVNACK